MIVENGDFAENAYDLRVFCWVGWTGVLGRGVRGEGKPSPIGGGLETTNPSFEGSTDFHPKSLILDPVRTKFDIFGLDRTLAGT